MTSSRTKGRTQLALLARGLNTVIIDRLLEQGHTIGTLQGLRLEQLLSLGLSDGQAKSFLSSARPSIPEDTLNSVLYKSRWTCCICRDPAKGIVVHHINAWSDSRSHAEDNLVVLCLDHHGEAHTKRELSLSLTPERLRQAREKWYAVAANSITEEVMKIVNLITNDHRLFSIHRGAIHWGDAEVAIYGNDRYGLADLPPTDPKIIRTRRQVELLRKVLKREAFQELAFATSEDGGTWVLLIRSDDVRFLETLVWGCFMKALEEQTNR